LGLELKGDVTHLNDIELLSPEMAAAFPQFEAGDVMISLRNLNTVLVYDPKTKKIKWHQGGPFVWQHDPDFLASGKISIFDNRTSNDMGAVLGGSRILELDPLSGSVNEIYAPGASIFFTPILGKQQQLDNGNYLVTEGTQGRVFEIDRTGKLVWEFTNYWDEDEIVWIEEGTRYPREYVEFARQEATCQ
jgi:hypothetical protein